MLRGLGIKTYGGPSVHFRGQSCASHDSSHGEQLWTELEDVRSFHQFPSSESFPRLRVRRDGEIHELEAPSCCACCSLLFIQSQLRSLELALSVRNTELHSELLFVFGFSGSEHAEAELRSSTHLIPWGTQPFLCLARYRIHDYPCKSLHVQFLRNHPSSHGQSAAALSELPWSWGDAFIMARLPSSSHLRDRKPRSKGIFESYWHIWCPMMTYGIW